MIRNISLLILILFIVVKSIGQQSNVTHLAGETFSDKHKYSNMLAMEDDGEGGTLLIREYFSGVVLKPKGYIVERYDADLNLITSYTYKLKDANFLKGYIKNGQINLLFLEYNYTAQAYEYRVHRSSIAAFDFEKSVLLSIPSDPVAQPLDKKFYNRDISSGFTTSILFDEKKSAFTITTHFKKGIENKHMLYVYNTNLELLIEHDFSDEIATKNYAFEDVAFSEDLSQAYLVGKAYFKKKRIKAKERTFQYELVRISKEGTSMQSFLVPNKFPEALKLSYENGTVRCVGFYADRKSTSYNGISYFQLHPISLAVEVEKFSPFSQQFMMDKFGKDKQQPVKDLVFKGMKITEDGSLLFNAEEQFSNKSIQSNSSGGRLMVTRYHYNDIVSIKLRADGTMAWARNINKTEVTQGDDAYTSYASYTKDDDTYFFISTATEQPQQLTKQRIMFKQGMGRNKNVFLIKLDASGDMTFKKAIDNAEVRLPLMVSKPLIDSKNNSLLFYAKRGNRKQLVKVTVR